MTNQQKDAQELNKLMNSIVHGSPASPAGIFGPFGTNRGLQESLLKESAIISGKIIASKLTKADADKYLGICRISNSTGLLSDNDLDRIAGLLERNL